MRLPKILSVLAAAMILFTTTSISAAPKTVNFVEGVDWTRQVITVTGEGFAPADAVNSKHAEALAVKAAQADAYRKLGEIINGVRVDAETTVEKMIATQDKIQLRVSATIKGAKIVAQEPFDVTTGSCRVIMQVPLFGMSNSLAGAVLEKPAAVEPFPTPDLTVAPTSVSYDASTPVKRRIEITAKGDVTIEETPAVPTPTTPYRPPLSRMAVPTLQSTDWLNMDSDVSTLPTTTYNAPTYDNDTPTAPTPQRKSVSEYASMAEGNYTGLIVDCRGMELQPVMSPVIKNSNGTKIYGHKNLDIDKVISIGMADYSNDLEHFDRAGKNPIVVRAMRLENFNSNPVISVSDSNRVLIENHASHFLKDLKVVFLFD